MKYFLTLIILSSALFCQLGCGVRGDPVPPKIPAELGRGQPTYKGATEDLAFPNVPPVYAPTPEEIKKKKDSENEKK
jgi:hypothetical protein